MTKNIVYFIVIAIIFGLLGGTLGNLLSRNYLEDNFYGLPFSSKINITDTGIGKSNVVIEGAKKLVVEQDKRIKETEDSIKKSIVSIFPAKDIQTEQQENSTSTLEQAIQNNKYYKAGEEKGSGLIVTGDGWIMTNAFALNLSASDIKEEYRVVTSEDEIKKIDRVIKDKEKNITFLQLEQARDLPVIRLADTNQTNNGELVIATNKGKRTLTTSIIEKTSPEGLIRSSDTIEEELILAHQLNNYFQNNSYLFNLNEELVGIQTLKGNNVISIAQFRSSISSLLEFKEIKTPVLGIYYIDLSEMVMSEEYPEQGALLYSIPSQPAITPDSSADNSELQAGDIITAVNNQKINKENELARVVHDHLPGDSLTISYLREGEKHRTEITLK